jgi:hypothetical protein
MKILFVVLGIIAFFGLVAAAIVYEASNTTPVILLVVTAVFFIRFYIRTDNFYRMKEATRISIGEREKGDRKMGEGKSTSKLGWIVGPLLGAAVVSFFWFALSRNRFTFISISDCIETPLREQRTFRIDTQTKEVEKLDVRKGEYVKVGICPYETAFYCRTFGAGPARYHKVCN